MRLEGRLERSRIKEVKPAHESFEEQIDKMKKMKRLLDELKFLDDMSNETSIHNTSDIDQAWIRENEGKEYNIPYYSNEPKEEVFEEYNEETELFDSILTKLTMGMDKLSAYPNRIDSDELHHKSL